MKIMIIWGVIVTAVFVLFPRQISSLFFYEPEVLEIAVGYMIIIGLGEAFLCVEMLTMEHCPVLGKQKSAYQSASCLPVPAFPWRLSLPVPHLV